MRRPETSRQIAKLRRRESARHRRIRGLSGIGCVAIGAMIVVSGIALAPGGTDSNLRVRGVTVARADLLSDATPRGGRNAWRPGIAAARRFGARREGSVSFAVTTGASTFSMNGRRRAPLASVVKVPLMAAALKEARGHDLSPGEGELIEAMVRRSDNEAATRIFDVVGIGKLAAISRAGGMARFEPEYAWGLSTSDALDQARFMRRLPALLPPRHRKAALAHLHGVVGWQRWGLARVPHPGWSLHFKGGWGIGSVGFDGTVNHQVALLRRGKDRLGLAILTQGNPTHRYGTETIEGVARALLKGLGSHTLLGS